MSLHKWISALLLIGLLLSFLTPETVGYASPANDVQSIMLAPLSIHTQTGTTAGDPANLIKKDLSGTLDNPAKYVAFMTSGSIYRGYRSYKLPASGIRGAITSLTIRVNYKGPAMSTQTWSWYLFDWDESQWVKAGDNQGVRANTWSFLRLGATLANPVRFINRSTLEIRLRLTSSNSKQDAKLDYEAILLMYDLIPPTSLLRGLAYSPYRDCQSSDTQIKPTQENIVQDLEIIHRMANGIRTYSSTGVNAQIPALARSSGLRVSAGAWLGKDLDANELEIQGLIQLAQTVDLESVIVGNEALLRGDLTEDQLLAYIQRVKNAVSVPVTTAETGTSLLQHPRVMDAVDYEMVHLYPFWNGDAIDNAAQSVVTTYHEIQNLSNGKRVVIGETGWPSAGPQYGNAIPSPQNQARFAQEFITLALKDDVEFYYFDAFDEMWKTGENGVGQYWGLLRADRTPKYPIPSVMIPYEVGLLSSTADAAQSIFEEDLTTPTDFFVYSNFSDQTNHFAPGGWMGDYQRLALNTCVVDNKHWPGTFIKTSYTPGVSDVNRWAGIYWLQPDGNWGTVPNAGFDLSNYQQLVFRAQAEKAGTQIKFIVGGVSTGSDGTPLPYPSSIGEPIFAQEADPVDGFINLTTSWRTYHIDLTKADLHYVIDGFGWATEAARSPGKKVFYLDNIRFTAAPPNPPPVAPIHIYSGERLRAGLDMGVDTSRHKYNWVTDLHGEMKASYPAGQKWGTIFITVGKPAPPGMRASLNLRKFRTLSVEMRGKKGGEQVAIGIKDKNQLDTGMETKKKVVLTSAWKTYTFKLSSFTGVNRALIYIPIEFVFANKPETIYFRNVQYLP